MNRRQFLLASAADLQPMTAGIVPITTAEREARFDKARRLMNLHRINAIVLEGGTSMYYFTGTRWGSSERTFALVIPAISTSTRQSPRALSTVALPSRARKQADPLSGPTK